MVGASIALFIYLIILVGIPVLIGVYVYHDAAERGMNAALWTLIAILAPAFVGFIIYLLVRSNYSDLKCPNCTAAVTELYTVCPKCGTKLKASCPNCSFPTEPGWTVCPKCASPLPDHNDGFAPPTRKKDTSLGKILLIVVLVPILLLVLLGMFSFSSFQSTSAMNTAQVNIEQFEGRPETAAWIKACDEDPSKTYALHYQTESGEQKESHYLIYRPSAGEARTGLQSGLFGTNIEVNYHDNTRPAGTENQLTCISNYSNKFAGLKVFSDGKKIDCKITEVDYNPVLFKIIGE
jgi:hypothetical protein